MSWIPSAKVWLMVLVYGLIAQGCGHLAGIIAETRGKDPEPAFYLMIVISILFLAIIANGLAIIRKALEVVLALMGR